MQNKQSAIEKKWQSLWAEKKLYEPDLKRANKPFYNLMMFPYPSGEGLHVGHAYAFSGADTFGRFKKMQGHDVFEPMGFDAFGIHSENYAIKIGMHPRELIAKTTNRYRAQIKSLGTMHDWSHEINTTDLEYYKWTQWLFLQLYKNSLAVRKEAKVNWCPSCKTVLADEQVVQRSEIKNQTDQDLKSDGERVGVCERCETAVELRTLKQWFLKITKYAERLWKNLELIDWSKHVVGLQYNWIGRSEGAYINFRVSQEKDKETQAKSSVLRVFTTRPDTIFGATFVAVAPEHPLLDELITKRQRPAVKEYLKQKSRPIPQEEVMQKRTDGVFTGSYAINPATKKKVPIWVADYVVMHYGKGAIMGVPCHDERDYAFAVRYELPKACVIVNRTQIKALRKKNNGGTKDKLRQEIININHECYEGEGILIDSGPFTGMSSDKARTAIVQWLEAEKKGKRATTYRLRDWLISRQRYWGPPIPIIYCRKCWEKRMDIKTQNSKLKIPCEGRDYTVIDGLEYAIVPVPEKDLPVELPHVENFRPTGADKGPLEQATDWVKTKCPSCGNEARRETDVSDTFLDSAWYFIGYLLDLKNSKFKIQNSITNKWLPVDMYIGGPEHAVLHLLYSRFITMALYDLGLLGFEEPFKKFRAHGLITKDRAKMSKSRGNVVNPDEYIEKYGADVLRIYLLFLGPFGKGGDFSDQGIQGIVRFLERINKCSQRIDDTAQLSELLLSRLHFTIKQVTSDIQVLKFNTAIARLMELVNEFYGQSKINKEAFKIFIKLLAPFAPHLSEELWAQLNNIKLQHWQVKHSVFNSGWPEFDPQYIEKDTFILLIQVNGRLRDQLEVRKGAKEQEIKKAALEREKIKQWTHDKKIKRVIYIEEKLVNIVLE